MTLPVPASGVVPGGMISHDPPVDITEAAAFREVLSLALGHARGLDPRVTRRTAQEMSDGSSPVTTVQPTGDESAGAAHVFAGDEPAGAAHVFAAVMAPLQEPAVERRDAADTNSRVQQRSGDDTPSPHHNSSEGRDATPPADTRRVLEPTGPGEAAPLRAADGALAVATPFVPPAPPAPALPALAGDALAAEPRLTDVVVDVARLPALPLPVGIDLRLETVREDRPDRAGLRTEFAARLDRVIERMQSEFGVRVQVVETLRSQERQDTLYAQGRTTPGPVVTWTRASKHSSGLAADLTLNGGWSDRAAFQRLAVVAQEEGLRTLWPRDPGHIELPTTAPSRTLSGPHLTGDSGMSTPAPRRADSLGRLDGARVGVNPTRGDRVATREPEVRTQPVVWPRVPDSETPEVTLPVIRGRDATTRTPVTGTPISRAPATYTPDAAAPVAGLTRDATTPEAPPHVVARVARVPAPAPVARVAEPAQVARPATVAVVVPPADRPAATHEMAVAPGRRSERQVTRQVERARTVVSHAAPPAPLPSGTPATVAVVDADATMSLPVMANDRAQQEPSSSESRERGHTSRDGAEGRDVVAVAARGESPVSAGPVVERNREANASGAGGVERVERSDAAERIARVMRLQDTVPERPLSSVTLRLDHPDGGEDRIRIDLRGNSVGATMEVREPAVANQLLAHAGELREALEQRGLEGEAFSVRATAKPPEGASGVVTLAGEREALRTTAGSSSSFESPSRDHRAPARSDDGSRHQDQASARQRREQRGQRS